MTAIAPFPAQPDWPALIAAHPGNTLLHVDASLPDVAAREGGRLVYLASPYSRLVCDDDGAWCFTKSCAVEVVTSFWARDFALAGVTVASPILTACAMCHSDVLSEYLDPLHDAFWARWCQPMLAACASVVIPPISGWDQSRGVWREACWALEHNVPVYLMAEDDEQPRLFGLDTEEDGA